MHSQTKLETAITLRRIAVAVTLCALAVAYSASVSASGYSFNSGVVLTTALMRALPAAALLVFASTAKLRSSVWWSPAVGFTYVPHEG